MALFNGFSAPCRHFAKNFGSAAGGEGKEIREKFSMHASAACGNDGEFPGEEGGGQELAVLSGRRNRGGETGGLRDEFFAAGRTQRSPRGVGRGVNVKLKIKSLIKVI